jgi:hypothetical protein
MVGFGVAFLACFLGIPYIVRGIAGVGVFDLFGSDDQSFLREELVYSSLGVLESLDDMRITLQITRFSASSVSWSCTVVLHADSSLGSSSKQPYRQTP